MSPLSSGDPPRRWRNKLLGLAAGAAAIFCGWILYVETDKGQLIIQSPADNVELQIAQEGQPSDTTTLRAGDNTLRLRSGDYTLSLSGDVRGLRLEEGHLHVTRGQQHTATIVADSTDHALAEGTKKPTTDAKTPRYSGKSFDEWLELLQTERDQTEQHRAMVALSHLADVRGGREVMRILLQHVEPGTWGDPAMYAAIKPVDREAGMREVLQAGTTEEHARALAVLGLPSYPPLPDSDQPLLVALTRDRELQSAARDALARIRRWDPSTVDRFAEWARDDDPDVAFYAAMLLAAHEQQPTFVTALLKYVQPAAISLRTPETRWRLAQAVKLIRLLSSAEIAPAATAKLAELLNSNDPDLFTPDPQSGLPSDPIFMSVLRQQDQSRQHLATKHRTLGSLVIASLEVLASHTEQATHVLAEFVGAPTAHPELLAMNGYRDTWEDGATAVERIYRSAHAETANANLMLDAVQQLRDRLRQFQEEGNRGAPAAVSTTSSAPSATNLPAATSLEPTVSVSNQPEPGPAPSEQTSGDHATADDSPAVAATHSYDNRTLDEWLGVALTSQPFGEEGVTHQGREHFEVSAVVTAIRTLARNESAEVRNRQFANWREICRQELSPARLGFNLRVLSALAVADLADQALADIFQSLERMSTDDLDMGNWFPIFAKHVNEALRLLPQERVDARVEEGLLHGSSLTRTILLFDQRLDAATHLEGVLAASHDTNSNLAGMALERLRRIAPIAPAAKQRLETALEDPALQHIAARELFQLETRQGTFEQAAKMAESREPRQALLGLAGLLWLERQPATEQTVEDGIATAEDGITWLLEQDDWGLADAQRPMLDPRAFAILGLARNIDPELAARLLEKRFPDRTDIRDRLLKQSSLGGR